MSQDPPFIHSVPPPQTACSAGCLLEMEISPTSKHRNRPGWWSSCCLALWRCHWWWYLGMFFFCPTLGGMGNCQRKLLSGWGITTIIFKLGIRAGCQGGAFGRCLCKVSIHIHWHWHCARACATTAEYRRTCCIWMYMTCASNLDMVGSWRLNFHRLLESLESNLTSCRP